MSSHASHAAHFGRNHRGIVADFIAAAVDCRRTRRKHQCGIIAESMATPGIIGFSSVVSGQTCAIRTSPARRVFDHDRDLDHRQPDYRIAIHAAAPHLPTPTPYSRLLGLTTTGATTISGLDALPRSMLFFRQSLNLRGDGHRDSGDCHSADVENRRHAAFSAPKPTACKKTTN